MSLSCGCQFYFESFIITYLKDKSLINQKNRVKGKNCFVDFEKSQGCVVAQISPAQAYGKLMAFWAFRSFTNDCHVSATSNFRNGFKIISAAGPNLKSFTTSMPAIRPRPWNQNCEYSVHYSLVEHFRKYITYFCSTHPDLHDMFL